MTRDDASIISFKFEATVIHWRGPAPYFFAPVPPGHGLEIRRIAKLVTYGWGVIPVEVEIGGPPFTTSLFPRDDSYLLPLKDKVRRTAGVTAGDRIAISLTVRLSAPPS